MIDLTKLDPELVAKIGRVHQRMEENHTPMKFTSDGGIRTVEEQHVRWLQGRVPSHPGPILTQCDGILKKSNHQSGRACDSCFKGPDPFGDSHPWGLFGKYVREEGLIWGGDWKARDMPHAELPADDPKVLNA